MADFGTVAVRGNGQITMPRQARDLLGPPAARMWRVFGADELGVVIVVGERLNPKEALEQLIEGHGGRE